MITSPSQAIGLDQIEAEHALQIQLLREIEGSLAAGTRETAVELMAQLDQFSDAHFASEQILMRLHSWSGYHEHEREHGELLEEFQRLRQIVVSADARSDSAAQAAAVRQWLTQHISTADRAFAVYLRETGFGGIAAGPESPP